MKVLVLNCGSSSLKYQLINTEDEQVLAKGICERIGIEGSNLKHTPQGHDKFVLTTPMKDHNDAVKAVMDALVDKEHGVLQSTDEIGAVGHRVVHGGEHFSASVVIDDEVIKAIESCSDLAPLHNPPNLIGIKACQQIMPGLPQVAVFDTAFHQTMPQRAYLYAIPYELYEKHKIRRYGFHGTSHKYVAQKAADMLGKKLEDLKLITCHLGNGASICAVEGGKSIDTSMGFTPLEGLCMGTRSGDLDPAIIAFLMEKENISVKEAENILNKKSGVLGVSGVSSDFRDVEAAAAEGHARSQAALDVFYYRVAKYISQYCAAMNGVDALVFTAGLGENSPELRDEVGKYLGYLGIKVDPDKNKQRGHEFVFSTDDSTLIGLSIPTNEELMIARDTRALLMK